MTGKGSISRMLAQARPEEDMPATATAEPAPATAAAPALEALGLELPTILPPETRRPMTTRMKPSALGHIDELVKQIRDAGFKCTREYVLEAMELELLDTRTEHEKPLRARIAERIISGEVR